MTVVCGTVGFSAVVFRDVKPILAPQTLQIFFSDVAIKIAVLPEREKREEGRGGGEGREGREFEVARRRREKGGKGKREEGERMKKERG